MKICTVGMKRLGVPPSAGEQVINSAFLSVPASRMWPAVRRSGINFCLIEKWGGGRLGYLGTKEADSPWEVLVGQRALAQEMPEKRI